MHPAAFYIDAFEFWAILMAWEELSVRQMRHISSPEVCPSSHVSRQFKA